MTLILPRTDLAKDFITGSQDNVGIRIPSHTVALALLKEFESQGGLGVAAPSANRFGKVSPTCAEDVNEELSDYLSENDLVIDGGPSLVGVESTIINCTKSSPTILRPGGITAAMISDLLGIQIEVDTKVIRGVSPSEGIIHVADEVGADLILMGSHGRTGFKKMMLGSVAQNVLTQSPIPVLIVKV